MPLYSYLCKACAHSFDIQQKLSDAALTKCPECGADLRKVFGTVGVTFKGSGFYRTDSAGSAAAKSSGSTTPSSSGSSAD